MTKSLQQILHDPAMRISAIRAGNVDLAEVIRYCLSRPEHSLGALHGGHITAHVTTAAPMEVAMTILHTATGAEELTIELRRRSDAMPFTPEEVERLRSAFQLAESGPYATVADRDAYSIATNTPLWKCDHNCGAKYVRYAECEEHEAICEKRPRH